MIGEIEKETNGVLFDCVECVNYFLIISDSIEIWDRWKQVDFNSGEIICF